MPEPSVHLDDARSKAQSQARTPARFTKLELRQIFKRMVADELAKGPLPYGRRRKLMRYAAQTGLGPFEASMLIAQAQRETGQPDSLNVQQPDPLTTLVHPERWPIWFKLTAALIIALLVDLVVIRAIGW